jgi:hypothetical protein
MNSRSCHRGMPERTASLSVRRERKNELDMMSNCQPSLRAAASALGTFGLSIKPKRSRIRENLSLIRMHALGRIDSRERRIIDRQNDVVFVQHLVVLQAVHQRCRRISRIAGEEHGRSWHAMRRLLLKIGHERIERHLALRVLSNKSRMPRRQVYITVMTTPPSASGIQPPSTTLSRLAPKKVKSMARKGPINSAAAQIGQRQHVSHLDEAREAYVRRLGLR